MTCPAHNKQIMKPSNQYHPLHSPAPRLSALGPPTCLQRYIAAKLNQHKLGFLVDLNFESASFVRIARLALSEAESLAWSTPYAHLFLPALAEEKIYYVRQWVRRQRRVGNSLPAVLSPAVRELDLSVSDMG